MHLVFSYVENKQGH